MIQAMSTIEPKTLTCRTGQQFTIRTAQPADAAALLAYIRPVAMETEFFLLEPDEFPETEEQERKWVQDHLEQRGQIILLTEASGTIIGNLSFENGPHRRIAHRGNLGMAVVRDWRGRGIGTAMLRTFLDWAIANPLIEKVCLDVVSSNAVAMELYKKLGFVEEALRLKDIKLGPGRYADTIQMAKFVQPEMGADG
jgi:RimJ/RimL family protein N-acetyltransferase